MNISTERSLSCNRNIVSAKTPQVASESAFGLGREYEDPLEASIKPNFTEAICWYKTAAEGDGNDVHANWAALSIADMIARGEWVLGQESIPKLIP